MSKQRGMRSRSGQATCLFIVWLHVMFSNADASAGPIVSPEADYENTYTLYRGDSLTLHCSGREEVTWTRQRMIAQTDEQGFKAVVHPEPPQADGVRGAALQLSGANEHAVGYYACHHADRRLQLEYLLQEPKDTDHVTYIYIYVNGTQSSFADHRSTISVRGNSKFVVPCRPTMPNIQIDLSDGTETQLSERYTYNPKIGYVLEWDAFESNPIESFMCNSSSDLIGVSLLTAAEEPPSLLLPRTVYGTIERRALVGEDLSINCTVPAAAGGIMLQWSINGEIMDPEYNPKGGRYHETSNFNDVQPIGSVYYKNLLLENLLRDDMGNYSCSALYTGMLQPLTDSVIIEILEHPVLNLTVYKKHVRAIANKPPPPSWRLGVDYAYPIPNITIWKVGKSGNQLIELNDRFSLIHDLNGSASVYSFNFIIDNKWEMSDSGNYNVVARNRYFEKNITITTDIQEGAKIIEDVTRRRLLMGQSVDIPCHATGNPLPKVSWCFRPDMENATCLSDDTKVHEKKDSPYSYTSYITLRVKYPGNLTCTATNDIEKQSGKIIPSKVVYSIMIEVNEVENGFGIESKFDPGDDWFARESDVSFRCIASKYDFQDDIVWYRTGRGDSEIQISERFETDLSYGRTLYIKNAKVGHTGRYECVAVRHNNSIATAYRDLTVEDWRNPQFLTKLGETELPVKENLDLTLNCSVDGVPRPNISWFHEDVRLQDDNETLSIATVDEGHTVQTSRLVLRPVQPQHVGRYECRANGSGVDAVTYVNVYLDNKSASIAIYLVIIGLIVAVFLLLISYLLWKIRKEKQFRKNLYRQFNEGNTPGLNPDLAVDEQADLLPYDKKYEFPPEKLILMELLGAGAFGEVYKAEARGIVDAEASTVVAVKKVRRDAEPLYRDALTKELKIMCHMGKHLNVLNLLGACTKKIAKRELMVIVEYCKFGNIHNYILKHRGVFIDQLAEGKEPPGGGLLNGGFTRSTANTTDHSDYFGSEQTPVTGHTTVNSASTTAELSAPMRTASKYGSQVELLEFVKGSESDCVQPKWRSNYRSDYDERGSLRPLCSRDLICWSFQIACGMEYLASRKVLHGDLAARNILLAEDNVVKICDFGLARTIQRNDVYQKQSNDPVPVKWLALECLKSKTFSTQSDVWSFGVVLWELFSLGQTPYPSYTPVELFEKLSAGERLHRPRYADERLYRVMLECWHRKPELRPSFTMLQHRLGQMLEDNVRNHYLELNCPYLEANNAKWRSTEAQDYLAVVGAPNYRHEGSISTPTPTPTYMNNCFFQQPATDAEGYLEMSPGTQLAAYSARAHPPHTPLFSFDARAAPAELAPMLADLPPSSPATPAPTPPPAAHDDDVFDVNAVVRERAQNLRNNMALAAVENPSYSILDIDDKKPDHGYLNIIPNNGLIN